MNPLYDRYVAGRNTQPVNFQAMNPAQKMNYLMQAMANPAAFVKQMIPDIPVQIQNNPTQILSYLQQTRGITNQQIQTLLNQNPYPY